MWPKPEPLFLTFDSILPTFQIPKLFELERKIFISFLKIVFSYEHLKRLLIFSHLLRPLCSSIYICLKKKKKVQMSIPIDVCSPICVFYFHPLTELMRAGENEKVNTLTDLKP